MDTITQISYRSHEVNISTDEEDRWFFSGQDLSKFLPIESKLISIGLGILVGFQLTDLMAIAVEKEYYDSCEIMNFVGFAIRSGYNTATIERLYFACRMYEAWKYVPTKPENDNQGKVVYLLKPAPDLHPDEDDRL